MKKIIMGSLLIFVGCGHSLMQGKVAMKIDNQTAHICMRANEVKEGDRVRLYETVCPSKGQLCKKEYRGEGVLKESLGEGVVTKVLNEHYSEVHFPVGTKFEEGTFIEKE